MINGENGYDADSYIHLAAMITGSQIHSNLKFTPISNKLQGGMGGNYVVCHSVIFDCALLDLQNYHGNQNSVGHQSPLQFRAALVKALPIRKGDQTAKEEQK